MQTISRRHLSAASSSFGLTGGQAEMVERASLASSRDLYGPSENQISPITTGLDVTIRHRPVALLPTTQNMPSARPAVVAKTSKLPANIRRFIVLAPCCQRHAKEIRRR